MANTRINVRLEGGLGDHLLATRFIPAIREKYPQATIKAYCDTNGKTFQRDALKSAYGYLFDEFVVIESKKYKEFWVDCQFGQDNFYGALENVPDDVRKEMTEDCDKFYDLHIDGLQWMKADFDWLRYFYFFPKPNVLPMQKFEKDYDYVVMHLHSATSKGHVLEQFYIDGLVKKVSEFANVILISTPETNPLFNHLAGTQPSGKSVMVINGEIDYIFSVIANAKAMVATDSGFRYIAYGCNVPTITFSANCYAPGQVPLSHRIRWLMFPDQILPLNYSFTHVAKAVKNILTNKGFGLVPFVQDFDRELVNRVYTINKEKTK